ncbi:amino acid adenylation domain-containing protein [Xenorhabdus bovienii]|nr:amino acid adenylation domain-containing protein [Xenorhabdus bovienii]
MSCGNKLYSMTRIQRGIWATEEKYQGTGMFNIGGTCSVEKNLDLVKLRDAIIQVIRENQCLNFVLNNEVPPKLVTSERTEFMIGKVDFSANDKPDDAFDQWRHQVLSAQMQTDSSLYDFSVYKVTERKSGFLIKLHHIIADATTMQNMISRICECYENSVNNKEDAKIVEDDQQYFLDREEKYLSSHSHSKDSEYWQSALANLDGGTHFILGNKSLATAAKRKVYDIPNRVSDHVKTLAPLCGCSESSIYLAALYLLLGRFSGQETLTVGMPLHGRKKTDSHRNSMTVSTIALQCEVDEEQSFEGLLHQVSKNTREAYRHQRFDYSDLLKTVSNNNERSEEIFDVSYNYSNTKYEITLENLPLIVEDIFPGEQQYSIQFLVKELFNEKITKIYCDFKTNEYSEQQVDSIIDQFIVTCEQVCQFPSRKLVEFDLVNQSQLKAIESAKYNAARTHLTVIELFNQTACINPERVAVIEGDTEVTYADLQCKVNAISNKLKEYGISADSRVAVLLPKSSLQIAALLAIMHIGATYVPLERDLPDERIAYILNDSLCSLVLCPTEWVSSLPEHFPHYDLTSLQTSYGIHPETMPCECQSETAAYLIYTSGSTGLPKGTVIRQAELVNYCQWAAKTYYPERSDVAAYYTPLTFDLTVTSIFPPLLAGAAIKIYRESTNFVLSEIIHDSKATVIKCTPSHLQAIKHENIERHCSVRRFVVGGESLKVEVASHTDTQFHGKVEILNEYGPTETVVGCMIHKYNSHHDKAISVPIGIPIDNTQIYILDKHGRHCAPYIKGEIVIAGNGISAGYWNKEELTREKFVTDKFHPSQRSYLSGDLAYRDATGNIIYIGRIDKQIKIRGHRIELDEIESRLLKHELVKDAVVLVDEIESGSAILKAFIVAADKKTASKPLLSDYLSSYLPAYMVPQYFKFIDEIPLTFNGKVNTDILSQIKFEIEEIDDEIENSDIERSVLDEFKHILRCEELTVNSNFYQYGGDSIKAIQLVTLLQRKGLVVKVKDIFQSPTPRALCRLINDRTPVFCEEEDIEVNEFTLTPIMKWFAGLGLDRKDIYHQMLTLKISSQLDDSDLEKIFNRLISSHPILNTYFDESSRKLLVKDNDSLAKIDVLDVTDFEEKESIVRNRLNETEWPQTPLFQAVLLRKEGEQELMVFAHHLVVDGVSWRILLDDLNLLASQRVQGKMLSLPKPNNCFAKWVNLVEDHYRNLDADEQSYWQAQSRSTALADIAKYSSEKPEIKYFNTNLTTRDQGQFLQLCSSMKIKPNELFFAIFTYALFKQFDKNNFAVELEGIGRSLYSSDLDLNRTVGWFTSIYPLVIDCNKDIISHIKQAKERLRAVKDNGMGYQSIRYSPTGSQYEYEHKLPRFNYLGDFDQSETTDLIQIKSIHPNIISHEDNLYTDLLDCNIYWEGSCKISMSYLNTHVNESDITNITNTMRDTLESLLNLEDQLYQRVYTLTDFPTISLSSTELEDLVSQLSI